MQKVLTPFLFIFILFFVSCGPFKEPRSIRTYETHSTSYIDGVLFTWPEVDDADSYVISAAGKTFEVEEPKVFIPAAPAKYGTSVEIQVAAKNKAGTSEAETLSSGTMSFDLRNKYTGEITKNDYNSFTVKVTADERLKFSDYCEYYYSIISNRTDNVFVSSFNKETDEVTVTGEGLEPCLVITDAEIILNVKWTDLNEQSQTTQVDTDSYVKIYTKAFDAVTNLQVTNVGRTTATISFTPLTQEQYGGLTTDDFQYVVDVSEKLDSSISKRKYLKPDVSSVDVTELKAETVYNVTVKAVNNSYGGEFSKVTESVEFTTKQALSIPIITSVTEVKPSASSIQTDFEVAFPKHPADTNSKFLYDIEYYVIKAGTHSYIYTADNAITYPSSGKIKVENVNGGNTYNVVLNVYAEDGTAVSSEVQKLETQRVDDSQIKNGLYDNLGNLIYWSASSMRATASMTTWGTLDATAYKNGIVFRIDFTEYISKTENPVKILFMNQETALYATIKSNTYELAKGSMRYVKPDSSASVLGYVFNEVPYNWADKKVQELVDSPLYSNTVKDEYVYNNALYLYVLFDSLSQDLTYVDREEYFCMSFYY